MSLLKKVLAFIKRFFNNAQKIPKRGTGKVITCSPNLLTEFFVRDPESNIANEPPINSNEWSFAVRYQGGDIVSLPVLNDNSKLIGYTPTETQMSQMGNGKGPVFYRHNNCFGSYIDTQAVPHRNITGAGPHTVVSYNFKEKPLLVDGIVLSCRMSNHYFETNNGVAQLSIIGYIYDRKTNNTIAFVMLAMDNRYSWFEPTVMHDTSVYFVTQPIHSNRYSTPLSSESMKMDTFSDVLVEITITEDNLVNIINDVNKSAGKEVLSSDLDSYVLDNFGVLHEVFVFNTPEIFVKSGVSIRDLEARKLR